MSRQKCPCRRSPDQAYERRHIVHSGAWVGASAVSAESAVQTWPGGTGRQGSDCAGEMLLRHSARALVAHVVCMLEPVLVALAPALEGEGPYSNRARGGAMGLWRRIKAACLHPGAGVKRTHVHRVLLSPSRLPESSDRASRMEACGPCYHQMISMLLLRRLGWLGRAGAIPCCSGPF
jgi:hypothetical protein